MLCALELREFGWRSDEGINMLAKTVIVLAIVMSLQSRRTLAEWKPLQIGTLYYTIQANSHSFIHSFKDLYSTSSRKLLKGAPDSSTVKKNIFQLIIECV